MTSSRRLVITERAAADLRSIRRYTAKEWGIEQRDRYEGQLRAVMRALADDPERGRPRDELYWGCRSIVVERHVVFYYLDDDRIVIDRVLHGKQRVHGKVGR